MTPIAPSHLQSLKSEYARLLIEKPPVKSCDIGVVGAERAKRNALHFAGEDVGRVIAALSALGLCIVSADAREASFEEHQRYLGCLNLLAECRVFLADTDLEESIDRAVTDGAEANGLIVRRILNHLELIIPEGDDAQ